MAIEGADATADLESRLSALKAATDAQLDELDSAPASPPAEAVPPAVQETAPPPPPASEPAAGGVPGQGSQPEDSSARVSQEAEDLKARLASIEEALKSLKEPAAQAPAEPSAPAPEIAELDNSIGAVAQSFAQVEQQINAAQVEQSRWQNYANQLTNDLLTSDGDPNVDTGKIRSELRKAKDALAKYDFYLEGRNSLRGGLIQQYRTLENQRTLTQQILDLRASQATVSQREAERDETAQQSAWRSNSWDPAVKAQLSRIPQAHHDRFITYAKKLGHAQTYQGPITDTTRFVAQLADDYLAILRDGAHSYAAAKVADATVASPPNGKAAAPVAQAERGLKTADDLLRYQDEEWAKAQV